MKTLADILFEQGFGTRHDCRSIVSAGCRRGGGGVADDPDERFDEDGMRFTYRGRNLAVVEHATISPTPPAPGARSSL